MKDVSACRSCPRLVKHLRQVHEEYPDYHCRPVSAYGDVSAGLLIVGLAPGKHGANASGIPFTGDAAGDLLYRTLHAFGFSHQSASSRTQPAVLQGCRITNAVKCLPPQNLPNASELKQCRRHLGSELAELSEDSVILALGGIAHRAIISALNLKQKDHPFGHGNEHDLANGGTLVDSYHCSRYNTQTGRLTEDMFNAVFARISSLLAGTES